MTEPAPEAVTGVVQRTAAESPSPAAVAALAWVRDLILAVVIAVLVVLFLYRPVKVEGTSMMPTLHDDERLLINQFSYRFGLSAIHRGDTVVFWYPEDTTKSYIKRIIGLPGDVVQIIDGTVEINGKPLSEPYVPLRYRDDRNWGPKIIPRNEYFVLGDNRIDSNDSRAWGFVPRSYIYGKAVFAFWPLSKAGEVR
jgi:signal peptidase I